MLTLETFGHVTVLALNDAPHQSSAVNICVQQIPLPAQQISSSLQQISLSLLCPEQERNKQMDTLLDTLKKKGVAVLHTENPLIENLKIEPYPEIVKREGRQTVLGWSAGCEAILADFEKKFKPALGLPEDTKCKHGRFVRYHETEDKGPIERPKHRNSKITAMHVVRPGDGVPRFVEASHTADDSLFPSFTEDDLMEPIQQREGTLVIFDSRIYRQDPVVGRDKGGDYLLTRF